MDLKIKIREDAKAALRSADAARLSVLRMVSAAIHNREIEKRAKTGAGELAEEEVVATLRSEAKKRRDSIAEFEKAGRRDLASKEEAELKIIESYLPKELDDTAIEAIVREVIADMGMTSEKPLDTAQDKNFGRVMGEVMKRIKGQASGDRVSGAVKKLLSK